MKKPTQPTQKRTPEPQRGRPPTGRNGIKLNLYVDPVAKELARVISGGNESVSDLFERLVFAESRRQRRKLDRCTRQTKEAQR